MTQSTAQHTPGPMEVAYDGPSRPIIIAGHDFLSISKRDDRGHWGSYENEDADARLFAAAPELLSACQAALRESHTATTRRLGVCPFCARQMAQCVSSCVGADLRAAIAKATGASS